MATTYQILEPHWCNMFEVAIWQTRAKIAEPDDRVMILEMLQYGKRLVQANCKDGCTVDEQ